MHRHKVFTTCVFCIFFFGSVLQAKVTNFKFKGASIEKCRTYLILETTVLGSALSHSKSSNKRFAYDDNESLISFDIGIMKNINKTTAIGGSFHFSHDGNLDRYGFRPRYRNWISPKIGLDISTGVYWFSHFNYKQKGIGKMLGAALSYNEMVSFDFLWASHQMSYPGYLYAYGYEDYNSAPDFIEQSVNHIYFGVSGRSYMAIVVPVVALIAIGLTFKRGPLLGNVQ
ncbi:MAG: hypothetical protein DWP97_04340 [Calditrichaeota bacterium]|nr:MAG: hypothetical protein DWP97_04340 [Calditrichota bacterium]